MNILTLDLSFSCTGWAARSDGAIESGRQSFEPPKRERGSKAPKPLRAMRFVRFHSWIKHMLATQCPDRVIVEQSHLRGMGATRCALGLLAITEMECARIGIEVETVHSRELKKWATGNGSADKAAMIAAARERFPFYYGEADAGGDEADALNLLAWAMAHDEVQSQQIAAAVREKMENQ